MTFKSKIAVERGCHRLPLCLGLDPERTCFPAIERSPPVSRSSCGPSSTRWRLVSVLQAQPGVLRADGGRPAGCSTSDGPAAKGRPVISDANAATGQHPQAYAHATFEAWGATHHGPPLLGLRLVAPSWRTRIKIFIVSDVEPWGGGIPAPARRRERLTGMCPRGPAGTITHIASSLGPPPPQRRDVRQIRAIACCCRGSRAGGELPLRSRALRRMDAGHHPISPASCCSGAPTMRRGPAARNTIATHQRPAAGAATAEADPCPHRRRAWLLILILLPKWWVQSEPCVPR